MRFRAGLFLGAVILFCGSMSAADSSQPAQRFSLVVRDGSGSIAIGDLNTTLSSINHNPVYESLRELHPERCVGEVLEVRGKFRNWEAELQWNVWQRFSVGISLSSPVHLSQRSFLTYTIIDYAGTQTENDTYDSEIRVSPPIRFNLYYAVPLLSKVGLAIHGGIGLYHARIMNNQQWQFRFPQDSAGLGYYDWDVSGTRAGLHIGFALEYRLNERFSAVIESQWRFAKIETLKGDLITADQGFDSEGNLISSQNNNDQGTLYHYTEEDVRLGVRHERLGIFDSPPEGGIGLPMDIRQASLDLNGYALKIGLRIRLF